MTPKLSRRRQSVINLMLLSNVLGCQHTRTDDWTVLPSRMSTPNLTKRHLAASESSSEKAGRGRFPISTTMICAELGSIRRKFFRNVVWAITLIAPAI